MSNFTFKLPSGETFEVKMPSGATFDEAQAIFKQQVDTGGLTGFQVGDALSALTQASDGLASAQAQAQQSIGGVLGKLPQGADLKSLTDSVGPGLAGAINQTKAALTGVLPSITSTTTGASAAINGAISGASSGIGTFTGQIAQIGSLANNAIKKISGALESTPTNGINTADFAKQGPALGDISNLTKSMVTGTLAQANKLFGQGADDLTNSVGLGKFGFDVSQLEKSGFVKPGTAAAFLQTGESDLTAVLKSPLPWTGKDGVKGVSDLLGNGKLQDKIQQGLMSSGLGDLKQIGVPTDKLTPTALAGVATLAAKDATSTAAILAGTGIPSNLGALTDKVKDVMSNSAFAVKLTEDKVEPSLKQEESPPAETNTVDTATVDAAGERIVGNNKVPLVLANSGLNDATTKTAIYVAFIGSIYAEGLSIESKILNLNAGLSITQEAWNTVNQEFIAIKSTYNSRIEDVEKTAVTAINALGAPQNADLVQKFTSAQELISKSLFPLFDLIKQKLRDLANKIVT